MNTRDHKIQLISAILSNIDNVMPTMNSLEDMAKYCGFNSLEETGKDMSSISGQIWLQQLYISQYVNELADTIIKVL